MKKKYWKILFCMMGLFSISALAYEYRFATSVDQIESQVINLREIDSEMLVALMEGQLPHLALEVSEGESLPLNLSLEGDFVELTRNSAAEIAIKQTLFIRNVGGSFQFRTSLSNWENLNDFLTGSAGITLGIEEIGHPFVTLRAEIYKKTAL